VTQNACAILLSPCFQNDCTRGRPNEHGYHSGLVVTMECSHLADILYLLLFLLDTKDIEQLLKIVRAGLPAVVVSFLAQKRLNIFCF